MLTVILLILSGVANRIIIVVTSPWEIEIRNDPHASEKHACATTIILYYC